MNTEELNKLVEKYYEGKTSDTEELLLRDFFCGNNIPAGFEAEKEIFSFYSGLEKIPEPSHDFEDKVLAGVEKSISVQLSHKKSRLVISILSAAAGILILTGSYFFFIHKTEPADTFSDPELAYAETMKVLYNISSHINQGTQSLKPLSKMQDVSSKSFETISKSTMMIEENMKNLDNILKAVDKPGVQSNDSINR